MSKLKWVVEVDWILKAVPDAELHDDGVHINGSVLPYNILHSWGGPGGVWHTGEWAEIIEQG